VERHYVPEAMVMSVVGGVAAREVERLCIKHFGPMAARKADVVRVRPEPLPVFDVRLNKDVHQVHHVMGGLCPGSDHDDRLTLALVANHLGGPTMNNRLSLNVRERHGMAYNIECAYTPNSDCGTVGVYFGTDARLHDRAEQLVRKEIRAVCTQRLGTRTLHEIKQQIAGHIALSSDSGASVMTGLGKSYLLYDRVEPMEEVFRALDAITADDVLRVANTWFDPDGWSHLVYLSN
jgi:predicted Zn-dependent peptidase